MNDPKNTLVSTWSFESFESFVVDAVHCMHRHAPCMAHLILAACVEGTMVAFNKQQLMLQSQLFLPDGDFVQTTMLDH